MTSERAEAYGRIVAMIDELGPTKLQADEIARIRMAADAIFFAEELDRDALADIAALVDGLVDSERWTEDRGQQLLDDLAACGPVAHVA
jgi:hypothetical protein